MVIEETTSMWQQLVDEGTELVQVRTCERIGIANYCTCIRLQKQITRSVGSGLILYFS